MTPLALPAGRFTSKGGVRAHLRSAALVGLFSLALNLTFFFLTPIQTPQQDASSYDTIARLITGNGPDEKTSAENFNEGISGLFLRGFIYPTFVGLVYTVAGSPNYTLVPLLQAFILPLAVSLTYFFGVVALDHRFGLLASLLYALYLPAVWHTNFLLTETVLAFVFAATMVQMALFIKEQRRLRAFFFGLSLGVMGISHPIWLASPVVVVISLFVHYRHLGSRWVVARKLAALGTGLLIVLIPWNAARIIWRLPQLGAAGAGFGGGGGFTFYIGSRIETRAGAVPEDYIVVETYFPPGRLRALYEQMQKGEVIIEPILARIIKEKLASDDSDDWVLTDFDYYRAGIENWLHRPLQIPALVWHKCYRFLFDMGTSPSYPIADSMLYNQHWRTFYKILNWPCILLTLAGLVLIARRHREKLVLFVPFAFQIVTVIVTFPDNRYKYSCLPAMSLLMAVGALWAAERLRLYRQRGVTNLEEVGQAMD